MGYKAKNNARSTLAAGITNVATSLSVATAQGDNFPAITAPDFTYLTLENAAGNREVIKVTARTLGADTMTVVRAQDGTTARAWSAGDVVDLRLTAQVITDAFTHITQALAAHAASAISFTPVGGIAATDVQAALAELDSEKATAVALAAAIAGLGTMSAQNSSAVNITGGNISSATTVDSAGPVGFKTIPQDAQNANYTLALTDSGKHIYSSNAGAQAITVPTNAAVAFPVGSAISFINNGTTAMSFVTTGLTVYKAGVSAAWASGGTLLPRGVATLIKVGTDTWFISGSVLN